MKVASATCSRAPSWAQVGVFSQSNAKTRASALAGRSKVPYAVLTVATRVVPSRPGCSAVTRCKGHIPRGVRSFKFQTVSPLFSGSSVKFYFVRFNRVGNYSFCSLRQMWFSSCCCSDQFSKRSGNLSSKVPRGRMLKGRWIEKWLGVSGSSLSVLSATNLTLFLFPWKWYWIDQA